VQAPKIDRPEKGGQRRSLGDDFLLRSNFCDGFRLKNSRPRARRPHAREDAMALPLNRRKFLARTGALFAAGTAGFPMPSIAQEAPLKIGLLTVKTGPLAAGGFTWKKASPLS
jgi:hypothetical protein